MLVVGELNVDLNLEQVSMLPEPDKERIASGMTMTPGSSSAILAANARSLGVDVAFVGVVGADMLGRFCVERLKERRVDTRYIIERDDLATGLTAIYTYKDQRGAMTFLGAMTHLTLDDVPKELMTKCRHLHLSSFYLQSGLRPDCAELFRRAKDLGLSTSFDTNWDPEETWGDDVFDVLEYVDVFFPNEDEARLISGEDSVDRALERLSGWAGVVVMTCGADGVRARSSDQNYQLDAVSVDPVDAVSVDPVDAVGAGDSLYAGFLARFLDGADLLTCLRFGLLTGAYSTLSAGRTRAFDSSDRFDAFVRAASPETTP